MKKYEKILIAVFGGCTVLSLSLLMLGKGLGYLDNLEEALPYYLMFGGVFGVIGVLVSWRLRKRREAGKAPISALYKVSFWLSFLPLAVLLIVGIAGAVGGSGFDWSVLWGTLVLYGILLGCILIPIFPFMLFWQVLYVAMSAKYKKLSP
ncbi:hypothetical protein [Ruminococcus flavefaciens]|uniref:Uncharacterized protein n=1 Tax=Ruminococcus flavefaciens TaxID=1265 RepID=A0A315XYB7_RUMFL|nr:hypothetical protein [Ruminococcus flavefaciens]PWJ12610.1 hypothetical protein IE37_01693 [Ruminococcus flavefaciens]SSA49090.1 hypothetical protein SAMN02910325_01693 [Ruminococcus flavefaciens]